MRFAIRIPIALKLVIPVAGLVGATAATIAIQSSNRFEESSRQREDSINISEAMARGTEVEQIFLGLIDKIQVMASFALDQEKASLSAANPHPGLAANLFNQDRDLISLEVVEVKNLQYKSVQHLVRSDFLKPYGLNQEAFQKLRQSRNFPWLDVQAGQIVIRNSSVKGSLPYFTLGLPLQKNLAGEITHIALADMRLSRLQQSFSQKSARDVMLIDPSGKVLAHSQEDLALEAKDFQDSHLRALALSSQYRTGQSQFIDPLDGESRLGAYTKLSFGLLLFAQVKESVIMEPSQKLRREAFYTTGILLSVALLVILLGSLNFTLPIERLVGFTQMIAEGKFDIGAGRKIRSQDELGDLARAFDEMATGLKERDKVKSLFSKFHGSQVAQDLIGKDIALGGVRKDVTVFFSDIRGFTSLSETTPPEEVVELLNAYFGRMVAIITRHGGIVDKFIGDAIMAVWGAPTPTDDDAYHAVYACLEMRRSLEAFNEELIAAGKNPIKIGMGVHSGPVISGTIGSDERMEYTVIGDTVNVASRIEASTKAMGADLLISQSTAEKVGAKFDLDLGGKVQVKGKSAELSLYKVFGYRDHRGEIVRVKTRYSDFEAEADAKVKVA